MRLQFAIRVAVLFGISFLFRLLPFRPPNVEPILAGQMPVAKRFGSLVGCCFGAFSILLFDLFTGMLGPWTLITASAYGVLGLGAAKYFKGRGQRRHFVYFAIMGTLFYDAMTGLTVGPIFFHQPFVAAVLGQIPFTAMHLLGNISFAALFSPLIERWIVENKKLEFIRLPSLAQ